MEPVGSAGELTFLDYLRPVWRFKFIVVLVAALAAVGAYVLTNRQSKVYQSSTQVYVGQTALQQLTNPTTGVSLVALADEATFVTTPPVADLVKKNTKLPYPADELLGAVSATPNTGSDFLTISAQAANPKLAAELANGFAQAYLELNRSNLISSAQSSLKADQIRLRSLGNGVADSAVRQALGGQIATLANVAASPPSVGQQLALAPVPGAPASPNPKRNAIFALALALVLGIILSYLFDRRDRRIRSLSELESLFDVPVLAAVPHVRRTEPARDDPYGMPMGLREPHRTLRVNLDIARETHNSKVIMISSALPSEGKSTIVRNLALTYREAGVRVALVEADLRRPVLAAQLGVDAGPGLSEALARDERPRMQRVPDGVLDELLPRAERLNGSGGRLDVLVAGNAPEEPTVLLTDDRMHRLMSALAVGYDIVLVDSPSALVVSDALPLLALADGVIIVARAGVVTYPAAQRFRKTIERVNSIKRVHLLGAIANDVDDNLGSYHRLSPKVEAPASAVDSETATTAEHAAS